MTAGTDLQGYSSCSKCPDLHPTAILRRLGGICPACLDRGIRPLKRIELENAGRVVEIGRRQAKAGSRGRRSTKKAAERAQLAALRRLRRVFPDLYEALLAQERRERGLEVWWIGDLDRVLDPDALDRAVATALETYPGPVA